jgi:hypothetical protein
MFWLLMGSVPGILIPLGFAAASTRGYRLGALAWSFPLFHLPFFGAGLVVSNRITRKALRRARDHPAGLCRGCEHPLPTREDALITCTECGLSLPREEHLRPWREWLKV